ncbi:MAG: PIN domain-containing protein [Desulfobacterales bacterium]|nr:PIN domain-containing protein [Desulfobacterales bacterium]
MDKVIIDTSAWIESFRPQSDKELGNLVKDLILNGRILLPGIIKTELLKGTKNKKEYNRLNGLLKGLEYFPVPEEFWEKLSLFSFGLFGKGIAVPLIDTYIALLCIEKKALILHRDKHFDLIAQKFPLKVMDS